MESLIDKKSVSFNGLVITTTTGTLTITGSSVFTVPATGTAALLGTGQTFTDLQAITASHATTAPLVITQTGAGALLSLTNGSQSFSVGNTGNIGIDAAAWPYAAINVASDITGSTTGYGIRFANQIKSDVTTQHYGIQSVPATEAASFTIGAIYHFGAYGLTIGAGSSVTTQAGFYVRSTMTGATNNYGFWGQLAAATGVWNIFCNGTAQNAIAGNLSLGKSTAPNVQLDIVDTSEQVRVGYSATEYLSLTQGAAGTMTYAITTGGTALHSFSNPISVGTLTVSTTMSVKADILEAPFFAQDAGANDTYAATLSPAITAYVTGCRYRFKANTANTGTCSINFNALGAKTIVKAAGGITTTLDSNDIRAGQWVDLVYDGMNMQMQSTLGNAGGGGLTAAQTGALNLALTNSYL